MRTLRAFFALLIAAGFLLGWTSAGDEPGRPLTARGLENLLAFSRLYGFVRYFHPSDEAAAADWNRFAVDGARAVEGAATPEELVATLQRLFRPIAPTVSVFTTVGDLPSLTRSEPPPDAARARVVAWRHVGPEIGWAVGSADAGDSVREPAGSAFRSERVWAGPPVARDSLTRRGMPDPRDPWMTDLTHGITCVVPLALYADETGTLPAAEGGQSQADAAHAGAQAAGQASGPATEPAAGDDRATRFAAVIVAWNALQQFYPYFEEVPAHWPSALARTLMQAAGVPDARVLQLVLAQMVAELNDGQATVRSERSPAAAWLPLQWAWVEGKLVVTRVAPEVSALVHRGDVVTSIDGRPIEQMLSAAEAVVSAATPAHRRHRALRELRRGPTGTTLRAELLRPDGSTVTVEIPRIAADLAPADRPVAVAPGVIYCDVSAVDGDSLRALLPPLAAAPALVLDLRGGAGGSALLEHLLDAPTVFERWRQVVVTRPDREQIAFQSRPWALAPAEPRLRGRVVFLADAGTRGRAEALLSAVKHHRLAEIVGEPTAGTDGCVASLSVPGGFEIRFTAMKALAPDGTRHHGAGVRPTIVARPTQAGLVAGRDEVLERAVALLQESRGR